MPKTILLTAFVLTVLSAPAHALVWVGTPVGLEADPILGEHDATLEFQGAHLQPCGQGSPFILAGAEVNLHGGTISMPTGTWCGLVLEDVVITLDGETSVSEALFVQVELESVSIPTPFAVTLPESGPRPPVRLWAAGWLGDLGLEADEPIDIGYGDPLHGELVGALESDSLWVAP